MSVSPRWRASPYDEMIPARMIQPSHPANMREKMSVGDELRQRLLDVTGGDQTDMPLRDLQ